VVKKVGVYVRVSTKDKQDLSNQINPLKEYCEKKGLKIFKIYRDKESGSEKNRPQFKLLMEEALKRSFDVVLVWALDRFTREGVRACLNYLNTLDEAGVKFISYSEPYINTDNEFARDIILSVMSALAKQEKVRLVKRINAGLDRARKEGTRLGRPSVLSPELEKKIIELRSEGWAAEWWPRSRRSIREIAEETGISTGLVHKVLKKVSREELIKIAKKLEKKKKN